MLLRTWNQSMPSVCTVSRCLSNSIIDCCKVPLVLACGHFHLLHHHCYRKPREWPCCGADFKQCVFGVTRAKTIYAVDTRDCGMAGRAGGFRVLIRPARLRVISF